MKGKFVNPLDEQDGRDFPPIPEGIYHLKIERINEKTSKSGDPMVGVGFVIENDERYNGRWVWDNIVLSDEPESKGYKIRGRTIHFLKCIGEAHEIPFDYDTDNWFGKRVIARIYHEEFNGKTQERIGEYKNAETQNDVPF